MDIIITDTNGAKHRGSFDVIQEGIWGRKRKPQMTIRFKTRDGEYAMPLTNVKRIELA